jgi:hypothetical protein
MHQSITPSLQSVLRRSEPIDGSTGSPCAEWQTSNYSLTVRAELSRNMNRLKSFQQPAGPHRSWPEAKLRHCVDRAVSLEERRHRDEQLQCRLWCLTGRSHFSQVFAPQTQFAGRSKTQAHCSGGLALRSLSRVNNPARQPDASGLSP